MQPSAQINGVQVVFLTQSSQIGTQIRYVNMTSEVARKLTRLGVAHVVIGAFCIIFQIVSFAVSASMSYLAPGMWNGGLFIITGAFGIAAGIKKEKCQVITFNVLSTISVIFGTALTFEAASSALTARPFHSNAHLNAAMAMESLLAAMGVAEGIVAICSLVACRKLGACCCDCGDSCCCPTDSQYHQFHNPVQSACAQQQFVNQEQPMFSANQQPNVTNASQPQLMFDFNQRHSQLNYDQQRMLFHRIQQQAMLNYNQDQPMIFPTHPMTQSNIIPQQGVQSHCYQPDLLLLNPPQPAFAGSPLPETTGQGEQAGPFETNKLSGVEGSCEGLIRIDDAELTFQSDSPPAYDLESNLGHSHI